MPESTAPRTPCGAALPAAPRAPKVLLSERGSPVKFVINRDVFSDAVSFAVKLLPQRPTMPILSGVRIESTSEGVVFSSFDF